MDYVPGDDAEPRGPELIAGDRCTNCDAPLAADQRYCLSCGQRRGRARFSFDALTAQAPAPVAKPVTAAPPRSRVSASLSFIFAVATLLLAMGVGVLIGHNSNSSKVVQAAAPSQQVIKIEGGGGGGGGGTTNRRHRAASTSVPKATSIPKLTKATVQAARQSEQNTLGASNHLAAPTTQLGGACQNGTAGCQNGHFTGNFFGP